MLPIDLSRDKKSVLKVLGKQIYFSFAFASIKHAVLVNVSCYFKSYQHQISALKCKKTTNLASVKIRMPSLIVQSQYIRKSCVKDEKTVLSAFCNIQLGLFRGRCIKRLSRRNCLSDCARIQRQLLPLP